MALVTGEAWALSLYHLSHSHTAGEKGEGRGEESREQRWGWVARGMGLGCTRRGQPPDPRTQGGLQQWGSSLRYVTNLGCLLRLSAIGAPGCRAAAHLVPGRLDYGRTQFQPLPDGPSRSPQMTPGTRASRSGGSAPAGHWEPEHRSRLSEGDGQLLPGSQAPFHSCPWGKGPSSSPSPAPAMLRQPLSLGHYLPGSVGKIHR